MKGDLAELKRFPQYFSFSLEEEIKPRHRLLVEHGLSLPLSDMLKVSDGEFNARLIEMRLRTVQDRHLESLLTGLTFSNTVTYPGKLKKKLDLGISLQTFEAVVQNREV